MHSPAAAQTDSGLRSGFTTGACAAAAAKGAALMLKHQLLLREVSIDLPRGGHAGFRLAGQMYSTDQASCFVVKDAGDDPDITNGAEIHASVRVISPEDSGIVIIGGRGVGRITKPGLAVPPGEWAINPVPRKMIEASIRSVFPSPASLQVVISVPDGEERARKTLNERLGIVGGLSILGTTGIVRPISAKAWTDTIDAALDVARACGAPNVVLSTGRTSELAAQRHFRHCASNSMHPDLFSQSQPGSKEQIHLADEAYIMMGDHVAYALRACKDRGFMSPFIACQFAKLLKMACGHENTHAAASEMDLGRLAEWASQERLPASVLNCISTANTAREIALACAFNPDLLELVQKQALQSLRRHAADITPQFLLADYAGTIVNYPR